MIKSPSTIILPVKIDLIKLSYSLSSHLYGVYYATTRPLGPSKNEIGGEVNKYPIHEVLFDSVRIPCTVKLWD